jgi:hypothetical protein
MHLRNCGAALALVLGAATGNPAAAQDPPAAPVAAPEARAEDVASPDAIIAALYDVISGAAGEKREWDRFRSLFIPGARLIPTGRRPDGSVGHAVLTPEDYITRSGKLLEERGFFEREIGRTTAEFGAMLHAFSAYDSRWREDEEPFARGINSIQLLNDGKRWWVVTVFWDAEREGQPLPEKYLNR